MKVAPLREDQIKTTRVDRRSFIARAVGAGAIAVGAAVATTACGGDKCDTADTETDITDLAGSQPHDTRDYDGGGESR